MTVTISTAIATYFLIWWIVLFTVLPWGVRAQGEESAPGTDPGAPVVPRLLAKLLWTTVVAFVVWALVAVIYLSGWITMDRVSSWFGFPAPNL
jgi:predicted secreted protein